MPSRWPLDTQKNWNDLGYTFLLGLSKQKDGALRECEWVVIISAFHTFHRLTDRKGKSADGSRRVSEFV